MTNKSSANTNLVPIFIIIALILTAGFLLTKDDIELPWQSGNKLTAQRLNGFPREIPTLEEVEKLRKVLKSQQELDELIQKIDPTGSTQVNDNINFDKEMIIVATSETLTTDGYKIKIKKVYNDADDEDLKAVIEYIKPGKTCEVQKVSNVVIDMIKIKKSELPVEFERQEKEEECGDIDLEQVEDTENETTQDQTDQQNN